MSSLVSSVIFTTVSQIIKVKAIMKYGLAHEPNPRSPPSAPVFSTVKPHARAPAPPTPARGSRGGVVVCAPARRRPTETSLPRLNWASVRGGSGASGSAASRGSGWGPGPRGWPTGPHRATAPRAAGSAARGRQVRKAAGWGDERGPRSGRGLRGAASGEEEPGLAPAAARHVRRAGCPC